MTAVVDGEHSELRRVKAVAGFETFHLGNRQTALSSQIALNQRWDLLRVSGRMKEARTGRDQTKRDKRERFDGTCRLVHKGHVDSDARQVVRPDIIRFVQRGGRDAKLPPPLLANPGVEMISVLRSDIGTSATGMSPNVMSRREGVR